MAEFVVYEDSPLAEYLESVNEVDSTVKVSPPPSLFVNTSNTSNVQKSLSFSRLWRHSMFHDAFSTSLPNQEEIAFEEKFKYLIVTSPLLSEVLSVHHNHKYNKLRRNSITITELPFQNNKKIKLGVVANLISTLAVLFSAERYFLKPKIPIITLSFSTSTSLFFLYRHKHRSSIRQLYQIALSRIQSFIDNSDAFDTKVHRVLITIQEIELVSRGYRLSTPLSPISRIEQNSKSRKCIQLRNKLSIILRRAFMTYEEGIIDMIDIVNKTNLNTLYDMYNVNSIASLSALDEDDVYSLDQLKKLVQLMHLKRRECMVHFLALEVMTENHDSVKSNYQYGWKLVNDILNKIVNETGQFTKEIIDALEAEFYKPINELDKKDLNPYKIEDVRLKKFVHKLSSLEQQLRTMEAKVYLCNEDVRLLNSDSCTNQDREKLRSEYLTVQQGIESLLLEWESGKLVLESYLNPPTATEAAAVTKEENSEQNDTELPIEESEGKGIILDAEDVADILNLPLASKASVFEAIAGVVEKNGKEKSKKTRQERIEEMKLKRAEEAEKRASRLDSQTMVHELKSVLHKRVNELDLND